MAVWSTVRKSGLEGTLRIDAEYYQLGCIENENVVSTCGLPIELLGKLVTKPINGFDYRSFSSSGIPYIRVGDILPGEVLYRDAEKIQVSVDEIGKDIKLQPGDILFSRKGTFGRASVVEEGFSNAIISSEIMRLRVSNEKVNPYYISTFLNSKFGFHQVERRTHGVSNFSITQEDLSTIKVPILRLEIQAKVRELVRSAYLEHEKSYQLYLQAEQMLLAELGLDKLDLSQPNYYNVPLRQAQKVNRIDAEHFQPKYDHLLQHLSRTGRTKRLGDILEEPIQKGVTPDYNPGGNIIVVNSQHLGRYCLNIEATERTTDSFWQQNKRARIKPLDVMVYATGAYIGRTNTYLGSQKAIAGVDIILVRPVSISNSLYLSVYLNCPTGLLQAEKFASGSGQRHIYPENIAHFVVYLPSMGFQQRIADLVTQSWQARQKATELLEEAKRKVENMIEGATSS